MSRLGAIGASVLVWVAIFVTTAGSSPAEANAQAAGSGGWRLPANAAQEKNPLAVTAAVVANGRKLFAAKCQRCHGAEGKGDGPDADKRHREHMNLTNAARAADNPDGVVFYKLWNGRASPRMPTFSEELSREQAWALVAFVQTLRAKQAAN